LDLGALTALAACARLRVARARRRGGLAPYRRRVRSPRCRAPALMGRPDGELLRALLLLDAVLPPRRSLPVPPLLPAPPRRYPILPRQRVRRALAGPGRMGATPDPAVADRCDGDGGCVHAADACVDARRPRRGLHPHRACEGPART